MASDFPTSGDALRKLIHKSRAMPVSFGFNPGTTEAGDEYFAAHPRKTPELLGKLALTEGAGTKSAFGTFVIDASELHLTCFRTLPQLAKKVKKYLKSNKITLNVVVMDADGQVLDSDVEVLTGWEASLAEAGAEAEPAPGAAPEAPAPRGKDTDVYIPPGFATEPDAPVNAREEKRAEAEAIDPSLAALVVRLSEAKARAKRLPLRFGKRLEGALRAAAALVRDGDAKAGGEAVALIEDSIARVPDPARTDPKMLEAQSRLAAAVEGVDGPASGKLRDLLERTSTQIEAGQVAAAKKGLSVVGRAVQTVRAAEKRWKKAHPMIAPMAEQAAKAGDVPVARAWEKARDAADEGDWPAAVDALPQVIAALRASAA